MSVTATRTFFALALARALPAIALIAGVLGMCAIWTTAAMLSNSLLPRFALIAAADMAWLVRFTGLRAGAARALIATLTTAITCVASFWMIAATEFGGTLGLRPLESALRIGPNLVWELTRLRSESSDAAWVIAALVLAAGLGFGKLKR